MNNGYKIDPYNKNTNSQNQSGATSNSLLVPEWKKAKPQVNESNKGFTVRNLGGSNSNRPVSAHTFVTDLNLTAPTKTPPPFKKSHSEGTLPGSKAAKNDIIIQSDTQNNSKYNFSEKTNLSNSSQSFDANFPDLVPSKSLMGPKSKSQEQLHWPAKDQITQTIPKSKEAEAVHDKPVVVPDTSSLKNFILLPKKSTKTTPTTSFRKTRSAERLQIENSAIIRQPTNMLPLEKGMLVLSKKKDKKIKKIEKSGDTIENADSADSKLKTINGGNRESTSHSNSDAIPNKNSDAIPNKIREKSIDSDEVKEFSKKLGLDPTQLDDSSLTEEEIVQFKQNHKLKSATQAKQERMQSFKDKITNWATTRNTVFHIQNEDEISSGSDSSEKLK